MYSKFTLALGTALAAIVLCCFVESSLGQDALTAPVAEGDESRDRAFEQWAAPYRELNIPLVSMEAAESYSPAPILPVLPENMERNHL